MQVYLDIKEVLLFLGMNSKFFYRFHRAAFIFIANMALADLLLVFVQIAEVALIKMKNDDMDTAFNFASIDKGNQTYKFQALDEKIILTCK